MKLSNAIDNLKKKDFRIVQNAKYYIIAPIVIFVVGLLVLCFLGFNLGLDFTGGTIMNVSLDMSMNNEYDTYKNGVETAFKENGVSTYTIQKNEEDNKIVISVKYQDVNGQDMDELTNNIISDIIADLDLTEEDVEANQRIGASASTSLVRNALLAITLATVLMLIYIAIRFELKSGLSAIVALLHDVIIMCALVAIFRIEINSSFIAAIITIIGYSINNTIVLFDRIRENLRKDKYANISNAEMVDISIKDTFTRTVNTTITTLLAVVLLAIIGVADIREFVIPIIFGLVAGTYSSLFIAPSLWAKIYNKNKDTKLQKSKLKAIEPSKKENDLQV